MKNYILTFLIASSLYAEEAALNPSAPMQEAFAPQEPQELIVYNRILARISGKSISVIDVMKKMDLFLQRHYPQVVESRMARFQFYSNQWKEFLDQMVNQELILADAERLELKVTDADVREEMLERFGPSIMATLDTIDLSYEEARKMIHSELVVQRMMWFRVNSKALNRVSPQEIKLAYKDFCTKNPSLEEWNYQVLALRSDNKSISEQLAHKASDLLHSAQTDIVAVAEKIKAEAPPEETIHINVSTDLTADEKTIAKAHKDVLSTLQVGAFSDPIPQLSRVDGSIVYRIFHLKDHTVKKTPSFAKLSEKIRDELINIAAAKENEQYIAKLRSRLGYDQKLILEPFPDDFQPFALR